MVSKGIQCKSTPLDTTASKLQWAPCPPCWEAELWTLHFASVQAGGSPGSPAVMPSTTVLGDGSIWRTQRPPPTSSIPLLPSAQERTVLTGRDVAALPVGRPWSPGAVVLQHRLVGANVHAVHAPGLEAIVSAGSCTHGPQADPPVHAADVSPAVLSAQRPTGRREKGPCHSLCCTRSK